MKYLIIIAGLLFHACSGTSECIDDRIATFEEVNSERSFTFIYTFEQDGETYYIFDNGIAFDATAEVVDKDCNVVCNYGGFRPASENSCELYQNGINNAVKIWPK